MFFMLNRPQNLKVYSCKKNCPLSQLALITQWQNPKFIYAEILHKTSLALMFTSDIFQINFSFIIFMLYFVSLRDRILILFLLRTWPEYLFPKNFQIPFRIKWSSPKRYICGSRGGHASLFVLGYRLVKTYFNRIFPVSSLSFFFLPCFVICFELRLGIF